jgi:hypothetical protein
MVSVQQKTTFGTEEFSLLQQHCFNNMPAARAGARCISGGNFNNFASSLGCFETKFVKESEPSHISHRPIQTSCAFESAHFLNTDDVIILHEVIRYLEMKVPTLVANLLMRPCDQGTCFFPAVTSPDLPGESLLPRSEQVFCLFKEVGVLNLIAVTVGQETLTPNIYANFPACRKQRFLRHFVTGESDKPLATWSPTDSDCLDFTLNRTRKKEFKSANILDIQVSAFQLPACLFEREGIIGVLPTKAWEARPTVFFSDAPKERFICLVQSLKNILEDLRPNSLEFVGFLFEFQQLSHLLINRDRLLLLMICVDTLFKGDIIEIAAETKPLFTRGFGLPTDSRSIKESLSHILDCASMYFLMVSFEIFPAVETKYKCVQREGILSK